MLHNDPHEQKRNESTTIINNYYNSSISTVGKMFSTTVNGNDNSISMGDNNNVQQKSIPIININVDETPDFEQINLKFGEEIYPMYRWKELAENLSFTSTLHINQMKWKF